MFNITHKIMKMEFEVFQVFDSWEDMPKEEQIKNSTGNFTPISLDFQCNLVCLVFLTFLWAS